MTLREFFDYLGQNPGVLLAYFLFVPFTALIANLMGRGEGHLSPWKYLYALLIFMVCIPGICAVTLSVYQFLFERGSVMNADVLLQILPIVSMIATLAIIRRNVAFEHVPGFDRISGLMFGIGAIITLMYLLDRTRIFAFVNIPVHYLLLLIVGLLVAFRLALKRVLA